MQSGQEQPGRKALETTTFAMEKTTSQDNPKLLAYENGKPLPNEVKV
jgi:hypothetical protein